MAKNKVLKKYDELLDVDFSDEMEPSDETIAGMMSGMIEASQHQQIMAIELTKLVVGKNSDNMSEENVFSVFNRASKVVAENFPLKELWEKFN
jgi:hypothetical protein